MTDETHLSGLETGAQAALNDWLPAFGKSGLGMVIEDPLHRRLLESASAHIDLTPSILSPSESDLEVLCGFEMIVADEAEAVRIQAALTGREQLNDVVQPAIVAVRQQALAAKPAVEGSEATEAKFDGVLLLPMSPAAVAAQLSLMLYAHRAFARRFQSTLEELHLNRRIFRSVTSGISVANALLPDMPLVYVNPAFEVMTGYSLNDVRGLNCRFLQAQETDQPGVDLIREAIRERREVVAILKNFRKDGTSFWNELSLSPIRNRDGELTHFVGIQSDVTARVEFEAALRESEKLAAVGRLASSIAHEINNPLETVMNLLYLAQQTDDAEESRRYVAQADKEVQRVALVTSQSLRFYKQSTRPTAVLAGELLHAVIDLYESRAENSSVAIERRERSGSLVVCLESEIRQVLNNLIRNALDAMHAHGGRLLLRTRDATDWRTGGRGVLITIADTGSGIGPEAMQNLYKAFYTTKGIAGTGLGLWVSSEIVARHQGYLRVRSRHETQPSGTVFELFLPAQGPLA